MFHLLSDEKNIAKRKLIVTHFLHNLHTLTDDVNKTDSLDRRLLDKFFRTAFKIGIVTQSTLRKAFTTPSTSATFNIDCLDSNLAEIMDICHQFSNGYGIAVCVLLEDLTNDMHKTLRQEENSVAKSEFIPILFYATHFP